MATRPRKLFTIKGYFPSTSRAPGGTFLVLLYLFLLHVEPSCSTQVSSHQVNVLPFAISPPTADLDLGAMTSVARDIFGPVEPKEVIIPFDSLQQTLVLHDNIAETVFSFSFMPEDGRNASVYSIEVECSDSSVLKPQDVDLGPPLLMDNGRANFTATVAFERSVGQTDLKFIFRRPDRSQYSSISVHYIICGISFFRIDKSGKRTFLVDNKLEVSSHESVVADELLICYVFIQFPDGTSSETVARDTKRLPDISKMNLTVSGEDVLASHSFPTCLTGHTVGDTTESFALDNSCSFGFTEFSNTKSPYFIIRLLKYRTGTVRFRFEWEDFLRGTLLEDLFEVYLGIHVTGEAPPAITAITPLGPFRRSGGQLLECAVINSSPDEKYTLTIGDTALTPTSIRTFPQGWKIFSFVTPSGQGRNVSWDLTYMAPGAAEPISCLWAGGAERFVFNYMDEDISITSLTPNYGPVTGGITISCRGFFGNFSLEEGSGDVILLGTHAVHRKHIISVTANELVFTLPALEEIQSPAHEVGCVIIAHGVRSNEVLFTYESLTAIGITVTGGSFDDEKGAFLIPVCNATNAKNPQLSVALLANVNEEAPLGHLHFQWLLVVAATKAQVFLFSGDANTQSLLLPVSKLTIGVEYIATVVVSDSRFKTQLQSSVRIVATTSRMLGVGLSVDRTRSIALPPVDARITAFVTELGTCDEASKRLSYEWTFLSTKKTLTPVSEEVDTGSPSPRRLGREYMIPRTALVYGKHRVSVKVYYTDDPGTFGVAQGVLNVEPALLQAVIGSGESHIQVSGSSDLSMSAAQSYDPDESPQLQPGSSLIYRWECELSTGGARKFTSVSPCPEELLPSVNKREFVITASTLRSVRFINQVTYVRYSLFIQKSYEGIGFRSSAKATQTVEILPHDKLLAIKGSVSISNSDGRKVDLSNVPFYESVILSPVSPDGVSWRFGVIEPAEDTFKFLKNPNNFIMLPGFYSSNDQLAGRRSLGIREGILKPNTVYNFEVEFESGDADSPSIVEMRIRTMRRPTVTFSPLLRTNGSTTTTFSASAIPSIDHHLFKFYFFVKLANGTEMCVDGCSGHREVWFKVPVAGTHSIRCVMVDARGKYVIDEAKEVHNLTVYKPAAEREAQVMAQSESLRHTFDLGDHSSFELECFRLALDAKAVPAADAERSERFANMVATNLEKLADMCSKTQPSTPLARDYLSIALAFASLPPGHESIGNKGVFYNLLRMVHHTVLNTPVSDRFDMTEAFTRVLSLLSAHARQLHSGGTSRMRLQTLSDHRAVFDVNEEMLCVAEEAVPLATLLLTRAVPCGFKTKVRITGLGVIHAGVFCNDEYEKSIGGEHATLHWCSKIFSADGRQRVAISLGELSDYIKESGVLYMRAAEPPEPSTREDEVMLQTGNMASHGFALAKPIVEFADAEGEPTPSGSCFTVTMELRSTRAVFPSYEEVSCGDATAVEYVNLKELGKPLPKNAYMERAVTSTTMSRRDNRQDRDRSGRVSATLSRVSGRTFGVKRRQCADLQPRVIGEVSGVSVPGLAIVGVLIALVALSVLGVRRQRAEQPLWTESGDAAYIERDVYGRDIGGLDGGQLALGEGVDDDGEEEVFRNDTPRAGRQRVDGVDELFREE